MSDYEYPWVNDDVAFDRETKFGPGGWTCKVFTILRDFFSQEFEDGFVRFKGADALALERVKYAIPYMARSVRHDGGPSVGSAIDLCLQHPDAIMLDGYIVGGEREDERLAFNGLTLIGLCHGDPRFVAVPFALEEACDGGGIEVFWEYLLRDSGLDAYNPPYGLHWSFMGEGEYETFRIDLTW